MVNSSEEHLKLQVFRDFLFRASDSSYLGDSSRAFAITNVAPLEQASNRGAHWSHPASF